MAAIERMLRSLSDELSSVVRKYEDQFFTIDPIALLECHRALLNVVETLARARLRRPDAVIEVEWRDLAPVEAAKRILWLEERPLKASEINEQLTARGWQSRSTTSPNATLCVDMEHAKLHVRMLNPKAMGRASPQLFDLLS